MTLSEAAHYPGNQAALETVHKGEPGLHITAPLLHLFLTLVGQAV